MYNPDDVIADIKKFLKKLLNCIENESQYNLLGNKIVKKNLIDDILCCIDASIPEEYKSYVKRTGDNRLTSNTVYKDLQLKLKTPFVFNKNYYSISPSHIIGLVEMMVRSFSRDLNFLMREL